MPTVTKVCAWATCQRVANTGRYCADHAKAADERKRNNRKHYYRRQSDSEYNAQRTALEAFYGRKAWRSARADVLRHEPLCRMCAQANRTTAATLVDHIQPLKARPDLALERTNLQPLCRPCHHVKTTTIDKRFRKPLCRVVLVSGPPGAGKTRYVRLMAAMDDTIVDLDAIMERITGRKRSQIDSRNHYKAALKERDRILASLPDTGTAWVIMTAPRWHTRRTWIDRLGAESIVLAIEGETCKQRIIADTMRNKQAANLECDAVDYWWRTYQAGTSETVHWYNQT